MFHQQLTINDVCSDPQIRSLTYQRVCWYWIAFVSSANSLLLPTTGLRHWCELIHHYENIWPSIRQCYIYLQNIWRKDYTCLLCLIQRELYMQIHNLWYPLHKIIFEITLWWNCLIVSYAMATFVQPSPYLLEYMESTQKKGCVRPIIGETLVKLVTVIRHYNWR